MQSRRRLSCRGVQHLARNPELRVAMSVFVCALFTSALVLAQVPKAADAPAGAAVEQKVEKVGKNITKIVVQPQDGGAVAKGRAAVRHKVGVNQVVPNRDPLIQQFTTQGRPAVRAELIFVRHVCHLDMEKLRQINRDADQVLKEVVTSMVDAQLQPRMVVRNAQMVVRNAQARPAPANPDAGKLLQDGLAGVIKKHLSPEQWSLYQAELDRRQAGRKQIGIRYLVDSLDRDLYLSDQQRGKLTESLSSHWDDGWYIYLEYVLYGNQFYPMGIDPYVVPFLSDLQRKVWQGFQRVGGFWGFGGMQGGFMNDNDALEEELGEVRKADPANAQMERAMMKAINLRARDLIPMHVETKTVEARKVELKKSVDKKAETKK